MTTRADQAREKEAFRLWLHQLKDERGLSIDALAILGDTSRKSIYAWLKGHGPLHPGTTRAQMEARLAQAPQARAVELTVVGSQHAAKALAGGAADLHVAVPLLSDAVAAGSPRSINYGDVERHIVVPRDWARRQPSYCLRIKGDSMEPRFHDGDIVGVSLWKGDPRELLGQIVAVWLADDGVTVKKLSSDGPLLVLNAMNQNSKDYPKVIPPKVAERSQWWRVDWWGGHSP